MAVTVESSDDGTRHTVTIPGGGAWAEILPLAPGDVSPVNPISWSWSGDCPVNLRATLSDLPGFRDWHPVLGWSPGAFGRFAGVETAPFARLRFEPLPRPDGDDEGGKLIVLSLRPCRIETP